MTSDAIKVKEFTEQASGKQCSNSPSPMTLDETKFVLRMVLSEMVEMVSPLAQNSEEAINIVKSCIGTDVKSNYKPPTDENRIAAEQYDAMVDSWYYMLNAACKKGVNLSKIFDVVHRANMDKRFPDGTFHKREDGKIIKPEGWKEPNIVDEIDRQSKEGAW